MRRQWIEVINGREAMFDIAEQGERPLCPPEDRCVLCDHEARGGRRPVPGDIVGPNHDKVS